MEAETTSERTGVLVIRVWVEDGQPGLRARIIGRLDTLSDHESVTASAGVDSVCAVVRHWLEAFERGE